MFVMEISFDLKRMLKMQSLNDGAKIAHAQVVARLRTDFHFAVRPGASCRDLQLSKQSDPVREGAKDH